MTKKLLIVGLLFLALPLSAQKRKAVQLTPEQQEHQQKIQRMTANTQRIMFIDSMVVGKQQFLQTYHLAPEVGTIARTKDFFSNITQSDDAYIYVNELGNRCFFSQETSDSTINIYSSEAIEGKWTEPQTLQGINDEGLFQRVNYPFMMGDGFTFYFAADDGEGLGGYDIYVTRYDAEDNSFLRPANIGMPFNSEANDYMYVIDEYSNLGWFATDRNQPADSVCIYIFIPSPTRLTYQDQDVSDEQLTSLARLDCISQTWYDDEKRQEALQRLQSVKVNNSQKTVTSDNIRFVISDELTYTRLSDFRASGNYDLYQQLSSLKSQYQQLLRTLDHTRDFYATANSEDRQVLHSEILSNEKKQQELYQQIHDIEKKIRNNEILFLTNKR